LVNAILGIGCRFENLKKQIPNIKQISMTKIPNIKPEANE
jgi:hypothetical protein